MQTDLEKFLELLAKFNYDEGFITTETFVKGTAISINNGDDEYLHFEFDFQGNAREIY